MAIVGETWLTYREASVRVGRSVRTIKRWVREGLVRGWSELEVGWDGQGRRIVREEVLLAEYRRRLLAWPTHRYRMRAMTGDTPSEGWS